MRCYLSLCVGLLLSAFTTAETEPFTFTTIDVPFARAFATGPGGINDLGQIAGSYFTSGLASHGFLLSDGNFSTVDFSMIGRIFRRQSIAIRGREL